MVVTDVTDARRIDAVRRDFVANASHELKTPAASIQAAAETLRAVADDDPDAVSRFAAQLEREARRLSRIVADLLDLSRLESGSELDERVRVDASCVKRSSASTTQAARRGCSCHGAGARAGHRHRVGPRPLAARAQPDRQRDPRYTLPGAPSRSRSTPVSTTRSLAVRDTGVGIPARDLARVFERFYRVDRARSRETGGTGLGLSIVRHVAENHGGSVEVQSELGAGSTFTVHLPASLTSHLTRHGPPLEAAGRAACGRS